MIFDFLRAPKCFYCSKRLGKYPATIEYGSIDNTVGSVNICEECAEILEECVDNDSKDTI